MKRKVITLLIVTLTVINLVSCTKENKPDILEQIDKPHANIKDDKDDFDDVVEVLPPVIDTGLSENTIEKSDKEELSNLNDNKKEEELNKDVVLDEDIKIDETTNREVLDDEDLLILVNKSNHLSKDYEPSDLRKLNIRFSSDSYLMRDEAAKALELLVSDAKKDNITLIGRSAYRSYATQEETYKSKVNKLGQTQADKYSAKPGASEHQTGLAIDIVSSDFTELHTKFQHTNAFKWLKENCYKYGFILRYPSGKSSITGYNYEPWHYRYVGLEHAEKIMKNNLTLEEYIKQLDA